MNVKCLKCSTNLVFLVIICVAGIPGRSFTVFGIHPHCTQWCRDIYPRNGSHLEVDTDVVLIYFTMPGALRSKAWFCNRFLAGIVVSNPAGGIDICLLRMFFFVREFSAPGWSLVQSSTIECGVSECDRKASIMGSNGLLRHKNKIFFHLNILQEKAWPWLKERRPYDVVWT
jgi:hypothetical protein